MITPRPLLSEAVVGDFERLMLHHEDMTARPEGMDLDQPALWCPNCLAEYRIGFSECSDCHVPLTSVKPDPPARRLEDEGEHDVLYYDLGGLLSDQRDALELLLRGAGIAHAWEPDRLAVSHTVQSEVDGFMDLVRAEPVDASRLEVEAGSYGEDHAAVHPEIAGPGRRLAGYVVDGVVLSPLSLLVFGVVGRARWTAAALFVVAAAYRVCCVALWGRTPGKLVVGTRVALATTRALPGWAAAARRWTTEVAGAVPGLLILGGSAGLAARVFGLLWPVVVYSGIVFDRLNRGLHDRVAATLVIND